MDYSLLNKLFSLILLENRLVFERIIVYLLDAFSSASKLAEELEKNVEVLLLDQDICQSQSPGKDSHGEQACSQMEAIFHDF